MNPRSRRRPTNSHSHPGGPPTVAESGRASSAKLRPNTLIQVHTMPCIDGEDSDNAHRAKFGRALGLLVCAQLLGSSSIAADSKWTHPPPDTGDGFLKKMLILISEHNGYVTAQSFERSFNVTFHHSRKETEGVWTKWLAAGEDYYFSVAITHTDPTYLISGDPESSGETSRLSILLDGIKFQGASSCISAGSLRSKLESGGWHASSTWGLSQARGRPTTPADVVFSKSTTTLARLTARSAGRAADACITSITVFGRARSP